MADTSLSFHCIVCYEAFDSNSHYPVVLPCGHTYICINCANQVNKCMECRTSLFYPAAEPCTEPSRGRNTGFERENNSNRNRSRRLPTYIQSRLDEEERMKRKQQQPQKRLPLPKNLVLLSLMEAATTTTASTSHEEGDISEDEEENARITAGVSIATGGCGTYAVAAKEGLLVMSKKSHSSPSSSRKKKSYPKPSMSSNGVDWKDLRAIKSNKSPNYSMEGVSFEKLCAGKGGLVQTNLVEKHYPLRLSFGERVQVVEVDTEGWAKLSRGRGYIYVEHGSDLVKVGGPKDKACLVEGMIKSLAERWITLKHDECQLDRILIALKKELNAALLEEDTTFTPAVEVEENEQEEVSDSAAPSEARELPTQDEEDLSHHPQKPILARQSTPETSNARGCAFPFSSLLNGMSGCGTRRESQSSEIGPQTLRAAIPNNLSFSGILRRHGPSDESTGAGDSATSAAVPPIERDNQSLLNRTRSHETVDFRTGMSGHLALSSSHAHPHEAIQRDNKHLMSVHTGLRLPRRKAWNINDAIRSFESFPGAARRSNVYSSPDGNGNVRDGNVATAGDSNVIQLPVSRAPCPLSNAQENERLQISSSENIHTSTE